MLKIAIFAGLASAMASVSPASAGSWSVGVGVGVGPGYYGPGYYPPGYYYPRRFRHRRYYAPAYVYPAPPIVYAPAAPGAVYAPPAEISALPPDAVFDQLEAAGYYDFGVMAFRDGVYKLDAANPQGDRVSLEVSALDGAVQAEYVIGAAQPQRRGPAAAPRQGAAQSDDDPLVVY
jgi:hypothetical protein